MNPQQNIQPNNNGVGQGQQISPNPQFSTPPNVQTAQSITAPPGNYNKDNNKAGAKTNPNSTQSALQIAEIRDGIVIMNDGSFRSVVMVKKH